jgi:hypothetical protein
MTPSDAAADLVDRLARGGIDAVVRPLVDVPAAGGGCGVRWLAPDGGPAREPVGVVPAGPGKGVEP